MISEEAIKRGGSKLEITRALLESGVDVPVPVSAFKYFGQSLDSVRADFEAMRKPVIVRGSHPNDYHGYIDVLPTVRDVFRFSQLEKAVRDIETSAASREVRAHAQDWGQRFTPEAHILVQEQMTDVVGSMTRHPHTGKLLIQYMDITGRGRDLRECISHAVISGNRLNSHQCDVFKLAYDKITDGEIMQLKRMYEKIEDSGILDPSYSYQVEFGLRPLSFFQARPFKKLEKAADFEVPRISVDEGIPYINSSLCFGITPKEGMEIQIIPVEGFYMKGRIIVNGVDQEFRCPEGEYGILTYDKQYISYPAEMKIGELAAYFSYADKTDWQLHKEYRLVKRAKYSLVYGRLIWNVNKSLTFAYSPEDLEAFRESIYFSNGDSGILIPSKFM